MQYLAPGTRLAGRYRIDGILGVGGMGIVYRAHDLQLDVPVAVKVLRPEHALDARFLERFRRELILARQVSHRNVVRIHDLGQDGALHFLTMDLVEGRSLRDLLEAEGALPLARALNLVKQLARALAGAQAQGVVHRDLKPDNILIDASDNAFITDFGIARSLGGAALTRTGMVVGTPSYLSPEQARGEEVDGRSDLYTLGLIFFEMLADALPFRGGSDSEVLAQRLVATPSLDLLAGKVDAAVLAVLRRLLDRDAARRYQSAPELLADLDELEGLDPTAATLRRPAWRPRRAHRRGWAIAAAAGAALLLGAAAVMLLRQRAAEGGTPAAADAPALPPSHSVAVLPLADETGRPELAWTGRGAAEMLAAQLAASPGLRVIDSLRIFRALDDLGMRAEGLSGPQLASLAELFEADRVVSGRIRSLGERLQIEARLATRDGAPAGAAFTVEAAGPGELAPAMQRLAGQVAAALAVPLVEEQPAAMPAEAMRAYGEGRDLLMRGDAVGATPMLEEATRLAPAFTAAWLRLSDAYQSLGRGDAAADALRRAQASLAPGAARARAEVQARQALLGGDTAAAERLLDELVARYPNDVELQVSLGSLRGEAGQLDSARDALVRVTRLDPKHPRAWYLLAKYAIQAGEARQAIDDYLVHALVIQNQLGNDQGRADVLNALGVAYEQLGQLEQADDNYRQAAALREEIGDTRGIAITLRNLARLSTLRGRPTEAGEQLARARELLTGLGDRRGLADIHNDLGVLAEERGDYRAALAEYRGALQMRQDLGDERGLAESYNNVGFAYYLLGEHDNAMVYWRQALDLYGKGGNRQGTVLARQSIGLLQLHQGKWEDAARSLLGSLEEGRALAMRDATAVSLGYLGRLAHLQGRYPAALDSYRQALAIFEEIEDVRGIVEYTLLEAETLLELGDLARAARQLETAAERLAAEGNAEQLARHAVLLGELQLRRGEAAAARATLRGALATAESSHNPTVTIEARIAAARASLAQGQAAAAGAELTGLVEETRRLGDVPLRLAAELALAEAELARGRAAEAAAAARSGLSAVPPGTPWGRAWRLHFALASAATRLGDPETARQAREQAASELDRVRRQLPAPLRETFDRRPEVRAVATQDAVAKRPAA
jgi:tetratricopeptide (TPR) repeat protein